MRKRLGEKVNRTFSKACVFFELCHYLKNRTMRILHISKYYSPYLGGVENFCKYLVEADLNVKR